MSPHSIFIFIIASFEEPAYRHFIKMRKLQLAKYSIPHKFLFDAPCPFDYVPDLNDIFYEKPQPPFPIKVPNPELNPHMILKFIKALKLPDFNPTKYEFILRVNLSTFINFPSLFKLLPTLPTSRCCAGHTALINAFSQKLKLLSGAAQIFTPDFILWIQNNIEIDNPILYMNNDDIVISYLIDQQQLSIITIPLVYNRQNTNAVLIRLKTLADRKKDTESWKWLLKEVDNIEIT
jgi:hypothetical protein